jgi:hypothetical protein
MRCPSKSDRSVDWLSRIFVATGVCTMLLAGSEGVWGQTYSYPLWVSTFKNASAKCDPNTLVCNDCTKPQQTQCDFGPGPAGYNISYCVADSSASCIGTTYDCGDAYDCYGYPTGNPCPNSNWCK